MRKTAQRPLQNSCGKTALAILTQTLLRSEQVKSAMVWYAKCNRKYAKWNRKYAKLAMQNAIENMQNAIQNMQYAIRRRTTWPLSCSNCNATMLWPPSFVALNYKSLCVYQLMHHLGQEHICPPVHLEAFGLSFRPVSSNPIAKNYPYFCLKLDDYPRGGCPQNSKQNDCPSN